MLRNNGFHNFRSPYSKGPIPSFVLDFATTKTLDSSITFTRSSTAKYYNGSTSVLAEQNLFLYSNTFNNAAWTATGGTLASGITDPAGGTTAFSFTATALNATLYQTVTLTATPYTESIYIQRVTGVGVINLTLDGVTLSPVTITGSWVKYTYTATPSAGAKTVGIQVVTIGDVINIYGSQIENRSAVTSTNITTSTILQNYIPQLLTAAINEARFDYNPNTNESLGFFVEQSSTNFLTYSQDYTNGAWTKATGCTVNKTANIAPDGTQTANSISQTTNGSTNGIYRTGALFLSGRTISLYLKAGEITSVTAQNGAGQQWTFNLTTGVFSSVSSVYTTSAISVGNGWWRLQIVLGSVAGTDFFIGATSGASAYNKFFMWQAQLEALTFSTSAIPTVASQVTRAADIPPLPIGSWYNTSQGTWFAQVNMESTSGTPRIVGATPSSKAPIEITSQAAAMFDSTTTISTANTITANTTQKIASTWSGTSGSVCLNGGTVATGSQPTGYADLTIIGIGYNSTSNDNFINGRISKITYYNQTLTSSQLQSLTT